jgi:hypothetical protein
MLNILVVKVTSLPVVDTLKVFTASFFRFHFIPTLGTMRLCAAIFHHMHHFGLLMHASTLDENGNHQTKSKTEAMFIPARPMTQEDIDAATTNIVFGTQYVPFTQEFQYLGSRVTTDLKDVNDINNQLHQAKGQAAALSTLFHSTADTWSKRLIFLAIPMNTALYGAESWTLNVELRQRISSFNHTIH